jgi:uncharacterized metal-binding protein
MSTGKVHYSYVKKIFPYYFVVFTVLYLILIRSFEIMGLIFWACGIIGYILERWVDPDLDQVGITGSEARLMKDFKIIGSIMVACWLPYAYSMRFISLGKTGKKGHRSFFSHSPVIGTIIRLVYMFLPLLIYTAIWGNLYYEEIVGFLGLWIGLSFGDTIHLLLDVFPQDS